MKKEIKETNDKIFKLIEEMKEIKKILNKLKILI